MKCVIKCKNKLIPLECQTSGANEASCILATTYSLVLGAVAARAEVTAVTFNSALEFCKRQLGVIKANIVCRKLLLLVCCCCNCCCGMARVA